MLYIILQVCKIQIFYLKVGHISFGFKMVDEKRGLAIFHPFDHTNLVSNLFTTTHVYSTPKTQSAQKLCFKF